MNALELVAGTIIVTAAAAAVIIAPSPKQRPQPEPKPPVETVIEFQAKTTVRAEPLPAKSEAERVDDLNKELKVLEGEQRALIKQLQSLTADAKKK